jgi:hypothetical protein
MEKADDGLEAPVVGLLHLLAMKSLPSFEDDEYGLGGWEDLESSQVESRPQSSRTQSSRISSQLSHMPDLYVLHDSDGDITMPDNLELEAPQGAYWTVRSRSADPIESSEYPKWVCDLGAVLMLLQD